MCLRFVIAFWRSYEEWFCGSAKVLIVVIALLQIFFLQGRFIFGPDVRSLGLTIFLIVAPVAVFCVFVARKLMDIYSNHWGVSIMVVSVVFTIYVSSLLLHTYSIYYFLLHFLFFVFQCCWCYDIWQGPVCFGILCTDKR